MNKKYSDKTKEKVIEQHLAGVSVSDLVNKFNVSRTTIYTWIEAHKKNKKFAPVDMKKHKELQHRCERFDYYREKLSKNLEQLGSYIEGLFRFLTKFEQFSKNIVRQI